MKIDGITMANRLRTLAKLGQYGHTVKPHRLFVSTTACSVPWDWFNRDIGRVPFSGGGYAIKSERTAFASGGWAKLEKFAARYRRFHNYCTEVLPGWRQVDEINYADNSTEVVEVSNDGRKRQRMTVYPHGDVCF